MAFINTALGPVDTSELGFTLSHEHLLISSAGIRTTYPEFIDREAGIAEGIRQFKEAKAQGVDTVIDLTTMDLGRDIRAIEQVSRESGVNFIVATGTWLDIPRSFATADPDDIAVLYMREIEEGIEGTGIKAAVIKVANDAGGVTPAGEIILRAAARAQRATGVPIYTHTRAQERVGDQQVRIFEDEGVDLNRVCVGHSNDSTDLDYLAGLLKKGVWLGLDRYPSREPSWQERTGVVKQLLDAGYGNRLMLGHDNSVTAAAVPESRRTERSKINPDGYLFITRNVLPLLTELGATNDQLDALMVGNPRRYFAGEG
ncbi:MAG: phosphotriesterase-related protein [Chloroflexi bacterium]|nr:phosphotriesterase-related protein [Chloroflexota bacterium]MCH8223204.1 phosphotriesterase-related protein [Chloroflexota bacterium]